MPGLLPRYDRPIVGAVAEWWRRWTKARSDSSELESCGPGEVEHLAQDLGISASDLRLLASYGPDENELLLGRMTALGVDPDELARYEPATLRELQRLCTMCRTRGRCARDLTREEARDSGEPASRDWMDYCPNAVTLKMLSTLKSCSAEGASTTRRNEGAFS